MPSNEPDPYDTRTDLPVLTLVLVFTYFCPAPTHVFELPVSMRSVSKIAYEMSVKQMMG